MDVLRRKNIMRNFQIRKFFIFIFHERKYERIKVSIEQECRHWVKVKVMKMFNDQSMGKD